MDVFRQIGVGTLLDTVPEMIIKFGTLPQHGNSPVVLLSYADDTGPDFLLNVTDVISVSHALLGKALAFIDHTNGADEA